MATRFIAMSALAFSTCAALAAAPAGPSYMLDPAKSQIKFTFTQAGAENSGRFRKFAASVRFSDATIATSKLDVTIDLNSVDTGDEERDGALRGADLFDVAKFPQAHYVATRFTRVSAGRYEALGKLTLRNVTREVRVPFGFRVTTGAEPAVAYLLGRVTIHRLDFGVGQGDFKSTEQVGNDVNVSFSLRLPAAAAP